MIKQKYMNLKRLKLIGLLMVGLGNHIDAQYTYNHDATKMNQITIMEMGTGSFSPEAYYTLFHSSYKKSAASKNKMTFRTTAGVTSYAQVEYAEQIDSSLVSRAKIEALNVSDRSGGVLDLAWLAEKNKINEKMQSFLNNINRIVPAGGSPDDRKRWNEYYQVFQCAIKATQQAYMPNAQRKKEYLKIYEDVTRQNDLLIRQLVKMSNVDRTKEILSATSDYSVDIGSIAASCFGRWKTVGQTHSTRN